MRALDWRGSLLMIFVLPNSIISIGISTVELLASSHLAGGSSLFVVEGRRWRRNLGGKCW